MRISFENAHRLFSLYANLGQIMKRADQALDQAKRQGGNLARTA